jgi:predicted dehydrogenase
MTQATCPITRRNFLKSTAKAAAALTILRAGSARTYAANERLNIAAIGVAGQGAGDIDQLKSQNIVALCDVDWRHAAGTFKRFPEAKKFKDYRKMFDSMHREFDAVLVATPDHHHAPASMGALKLGKHVYCEKPLTHAAWEARQVATTARAAKDATQMGNQGQASEETRRLQEFVLDDAVAAIREVHIWTDRPSRGLFDEYWPQGVARPPEAPVVPDTLDWDLWLGPAPLRPYHPAYLPAKWRGWWDFGTGALGDIGCHYFDPVFRALNLGAPLSVEASSTRVNRETYPLGSMVTYHFPSRGAMPAVKLVWYDGGLRPPRPGQIHDNDVLGDNGHLLIGEKGIIQLDQRKWRLFPEKLAADYGEPPKKLPRSPGHYLEWIEACKGGKPAGSNFDWAGPLTETVLLGNVALRTQLREKLTKVRLLWDSEKFAFTNLAEANQFLKKEYRQGWTV